MFAKCGWCNKEMSKGQNCDANINVEYPDGSILLSVPAYDDCHDCNVKAGQFHHPGCDMERCPKCGGQLISCGCLSKEEDE